VFTLFSRLLGMGRDEGPLIRLIDITILCVVFLILAYNVSTVSTLMIIFGLIVVITIRSMLQAHREKYFYDDTLWDDISIESLKKREEITKGHKWVYFFEEVLDFFYSPEIYWYFGAIAIGLTLKFFFEIRLL